MNSALVAQVDGLERERRRAVQPKSATPSQSAELQLGVEGTPCIVQLAERGSTAGDFVHTPKPLSQP